jgi:tRNA (cmo5U34)-methyltransferase
MNEFDIKASGWDKNTVHLDRSKFIAGQLMELVPFSPDMKAMEFGAGTALLSFILKDLFASVTLIDNSQEMIKICNLKIAESKSHHIRTLKIDLETEDIDERFDIIYSQMAFHHIADINKIVNKLYLLLKEGGTLAVADLFHEDGSFHGEGFTGHKGFDPEWLTESMRNAGFKDVHYTNSLTQKRVDPDGKIMEYPLFLIIAKKLRN